MRTAGPKSEAVFATAGALSAVTVAIAEAPIDALSLASLGLPSLALCGTSWPSWLPRMLLGRTALLAFDADEPGDVAADQLSEELSAHRVERARIRPEGVKDWNEGLQAGTGLSVIAAPYVASMSHARV
jgi:DNA primase